uniref:Uncharacterized protein n=1 Tax=Amphora coffeiformis TaxID=265554 RepID=A0A7S3P2X6_9STRA|mmetsp:Transcript_18411/g.34983  ORF Transcript_18411/g.34983 Transcript_18411/m.34983 type:complete len:155 (-) Transcript_18411:71-535(-)|eukprot:scaffold3224_cov158-Amphora_coffeaeformis.AAC.23
MTSKVLNKKLLTPSEESPKHVFYRKSPLVPQPTGTDLGRETLYEPVLLCSPVLASQRIYQDKKAQRLITADDVSELSKRLDMMFLKSETTKKDVGETKEESAADDGHKSMKVASVTFDLNTPPKVGRFDDAVFSKKAKGKVAVKRSTRLAEGKM